MTETDVLLGVLAGATARISVELTTSKLAALLPNSTVSTSVKLAPWISTTLPPSELPPAGNRKDSDGAAPPMVNDQSPPALMPQTSFACTTAVGSTTSSEAKPPPTCPA